VLILYLIIYTIFLYADPIALQKFVNSWATYLKEGQPVLVAGLIDVIAGAANSIIQVGASGKIEDHQNGVKDEITDRSNEAYKTFLDAFHIKLLKKIGIPELTELINDKDWAHLFLTNYTISEFEGASVIPELREGVDNLNQDLKNNGVHDLCTECTLMEKTFVAGTIDKLKTIVSLYHHVVKKDPSAVEWTSYCTPSLEQPLIDYILESGDKTLFPVGSRVCVMYNPELYISDGFVPVKDNIEFKDWIESQKLELKQDPEKTIENTNNVTMVRQKRPEL
jgi:hypothetical protein